MLTTLLLLQLSRLAAPFQLGLDPGWTPHLTAAERCRWVVESGCDLPLLEVRADLFGQPGGAEHVDQAVRDYAAAGLRPVLLCHPGTARAPADATAGLDEPTLLGPDRRLNPANAWATFLARLLERYDGDGTRDAPGAPAITSFILAGPPDVAGADLARLFQVATEVAARVAPRAQLGLRVESPEQLQACLAEPDHPVGQRLDLLYLSAAAEPLVSSEPDLLSLVQPYRAVLRDGWLTPDLLVSARGAPADEVLLRAAVPKSQVVAAAEDVMCFWPGLFGGTAPLLRPSPAAKVWEPRDGFIAYATLGRLLQPEPGAAPARFGEELTVGNDARCYRFEVGGRELLVAWAYDPDGEPARTAELRLPLRRDVTYGRYTWEFSRTGRPSERVVGGRDGYLATVGIDPEYFLEGDSKRIEPLEGPVTAAGPPWRVEAIDAVSGAAELAFDGSPDTAWRGGAERLVPWWRIRFDDAPVTADRVRLRAGWLPGVSLLIEVSDDGAVWRPMSRPARSVDWDWQTIPLTGRVTSAWWRVRYETENDEPVSLYEIEIGDRTAASR